MKSEYPLRWPKSVPRQKAKASQFRTTLKGAMNNVEAELNRYAKDSGMKVSNIVLTSNVTLDQNPADPAVALYFNWGENLMCYPLDTYNKVACNLQAIYHMLDADRTKIRHGGVNFVLAEKRGQHLLLTDGRRPWHVVLEVSETAGAEEVKKAYKRLMSKYHPDTSTIPNARDKYEEVQKAKDYYEKARK